MWKSLQWGQCYLRRSRALRCTERYMLVCVCVCRQVILVCIRSQVCGAPAVCSLLWLRGERVYPLPDSTNAALPSHLPPPSRSVWCGHPCLMGLRLGPFLSFASRIVAPSVGAGAICRDSRLVVTQAGQLEGIRGVTHPALPLLLITAPGW